MFHFLLSCTKIFFSLLYLFQATVVSSSFLPQNLLKSITLILISISSIPINDSTPSTLISILHVPLKLFSTGVTRCFLMHRYKDYDPPSLTDISVSLSLSATITRNLMSRTLLFLLFLLRQPLHSFIDWPSSFMVFPPLKW